jgi:hypothetical protein
LTPALRWLGPLALVAWLAGGVLAQAARSQRPAPPFLARVVEAARSVDLAGGGKEWLVLTVEVRPRGGERDTLRHVQPLRDHFMLRDAGGKSYPCAWLKGGSSLEDPTALRFQAGFPLPEPAVRTVYLRLLLPHPRPPEVAEFRLSEAQLARLPASTATPAGQLRVERIAAGDYAPLPLPAEGRHIMKGIPVDRRLFRRPQTAGEKPPQRALQVDWESGTLDLFDRALEVDAFVEGSDRRRYPLLSASLDRFPARGASDAAVSPRVQARYWFPLPAKGTVQGMTFRFTLRAPDKEHDAVDLGEVPVPGR